MRAVFFLQWGPPELFITLRLHNSISCPCPSDWEAIREFLACVSLFVTTRLLIKVLFPLRFRPITHAPRFTFHSHDGKIGEIAIVREILRKLLNVRNVVVARICFHRRLWFCSQGGRHVWWGHAWQGVCMAGGMHGRRIVCGKGVCVDRRDGYCSGQYASYWNAFLYCFSSLNSMLVYKICRIRIGKTQLLNPLLAIIGKQVWML